MGQSEMICLNSSEEEESLKDKSLSPAELKTQIPQSSENKRDNNEKQRTRVSPEMVQVYRNTKDLTQLNEITLDNVINCLIERFHSNRYYTFAGSILISLNPCLKVSRRSLGFMECMSQYKSSIDDESDLKALREPHVYAIGLRTLKNLKTVKNNQVIIISGDSGAGKTTCTQQLIKFFTEATEYNINPENLKSNIGNLEKKIYFATVVLEAFGNASTTSNPNSSRFGRLVELSYDVNCSIMKAEIKTYLLEKHRVAKGASNERNFHIFYYLLEAQKQGRLNIPDTNFNNSYHDELLEKIESTDMEDFLHLSNALKIFNLTEQFTQVFRTVFAIMHLNAVKFIRKTQQQSIQKFSVAPAQYNHFESACKILGVKEDSLIEDLVGHKISATAKKRDSMYYKAFEKKSECEERLQAFVTSLYDKLFNYILYKLNDSLKQEEATTEYLESNGNNNIDKQTHSEFVATLSLLDLYGFENLRVNHLEQMCINYANERLQQVQVSVLKKYFEEAKLFDETEIDFVEPTELNRIEKDSGQCIQQIEDNIFKILDEQCLLGRSISEKAILENITLKTKTSRFIMTEKLHQEECPFTIKHYATDVTYHLKGMIEKNKDFIPNTFGEMLSSSKNPFIRSLFQQHSKNFCSTPNANARSKMNGTGGKTILARFKNSVNELIKQLGNHEDKDLHFIRCIRPNDQLLQGIIQTDVVRKQLFSCGVVDVIRIAGNGYPIRIPYGKFEKEFPFILRYFCDRKVNTNILSLIFSFEKYPLQFGTNSIFMHEKTWNFIAKTEKFLAVKSLRTIQRYWKQYLSLKEASLMKTPQRLQDETLWFTPCMALADFSKITTPGGPYGDGLYQPNYVNLFSDTFDMNVSSDYPEEDSLMNFTTLKPVDPPNLIYGDRIVSRTPLHKLPIKFYTKKTALLYSNNPPRRLIPNGLSDAFEDFQIVTYPNCTKTESESHMVKVT